MNTVAELETRLAGIFSVADRIIRDPSVDFRTFKYVGAGIRDEVVPALLEAFWADILRVWDAVPAAIKDSRMFILTWRARPEITCEFSNEINRPVFRLRARFIVPGLDFHPVARPEGELSARVAV